MKPYRNRTVETLWYAFGLATALALGLSNLFLPFGFDQAIFLLGARAIDHGAVLYVDYWDNKQPGLYYFWVLAGRLFGFTEFGIHLLELMCLMGFSVVLIVTLRPVLRYAWIAALAPVATVGVYYATVDPDQLTQLEMLVSIPIYLALWFVWQGARRPDRQMSYLFLGGLCAGIVVVFKLLLAVIVLVIWAVALVYAIRHGDGRRSQTAARFLIPFGAGALLPVAAVLGLFWSQGALDELIWTALVYPPAALEGSPAASKSRLVTAAAFYVSNTAPWLLFAGVAAWHWWRDRSQPLAALLLGWIAAAALAIAVQQFSWWQYHALLLFVPTGILAVLGIDRVVGLVADLQSARATLAMSASTVVAVPLAAALVGPFLQKAQPLISETLVQRHGLRAYQQKISKHYRPLWRSTRFLTEPDARPGPIYAFGPAMVYHFSGRECAHRTIGSTWRWYVPEQWQEILAILGSGVVPYVFVGSKDYEIAWARPKVWSMLETHYELYRQDDGGIWFRWRDPAPPEAPY